MSEIELLAVVVVPLVVVMAFGWPMAWLWRRTSCCAADGGGRDDWRGVGNERRSSRPGADASLRKSGGETADAITTSAEFCSVSHQCARCHLVTWLWSIR
jgi:hypothetical protein